MPSPTLCETFRALSFKTFGHLGIARSVGHQPLEETLTDNNILDLKVKHPDEIFCKTFNKPQEGRNGADWEWWLTEPTHTQWLGLRVQAKVLHLESDTFAHLHYKSGKRGHSQLAKLRREAKKDGLVPLYCFYVHEPLGSRMPLTHCGSFAYAAESFGCSLAPLKHVESMQKAGGKCDRHSVLNGALPWHCLVCCSGFGGRNLPERAWSFLKSAFKVREPKSEQAIDAPLGTILGLRRRPPDHVLALLEGRQVDTTATGVAGVLILVGDGGG